MQPDLDSVEAERLLVGIDWFEVQIRRYPRVQICRSDHFSDPAAVTSWSTYPESE